MAAAEGDFGWAIFSSVLALLCFAFIALVAITAAHDEDKRDAKAKATP